ncbi:PSP1 domain-containing protein [Flavicella marina]|uniref:PSP1 domain-containing protein n=1 Tax=Flavicella marina TaxID=1475951 RepID=UPI0012647BCE|nr:regulatory iron-sulfur-containing complex subunit RicT [Flavicella marina]
MGCTSCSTNKSGVPNGCKSNGSCATGSCDKLTVFDWLSNMALPSGQEPFNIVEVRFKNGRKHFFKNTNNFQLTIGEIVAVEGAPGHDIGTVSLTGELVRVQMKKKKIAHDSEEVKKIYRKASVRDIEIWQAARDKEIETQRRGREILGRLGLKMKLSDVEYQGDGNKATFYYTAEDRVDFRQLIKDLASAFNIRVEMKQVGLRQEAARLGGVGSCGRELCCSTWLTDFRKVNTASARYQQLSLNPQKLAGQCGKLKCCLNFELDSYLDALKAFPKQDVALDTEKGRATFVKMDIFKGLLWYASKEEGYKWYKLTLEQVNEVIAMNKRGEKAPSLEELESETVAPTKIEFENVVGQDSLTRFDKPKSKNKRRKKKKPQDGKQGGTANKNTPRQKNQGKRRPTNSQKQEGAQNKPQGNSQPKQKSQNPNENSGNGQKQGAAKKRRPQNKNKQAQSGQKPQNGPSDKVNAEGANQKPRRTNNRRRKPNNNKPDSNANKDA